MSDFGRWLLGGVAGMTAVSGYLADWNQTHLFNPTWPPHAKFHDTWSVLLGTALGTSALYFLRKGDMEMAALLPALYWATQAGSFAFPDTSGLDSESPHLVPKVLGIRLNEAAVSTGMLAVAGVGYGLACRNAA